jgi:hypothetical protein
MARPSSAKKVARAARAGGGRRARAQRERNLLFPVAMGVVVLIGVLSVVWARSERDAATEPTVDPDEALRAAIGIYSCGEFESNLPSDLDVNTAAGVVTFGDGLLYLPPEQAGQATLGDVFDEAEVNFDDTELVLPNETLVSGETTCPDGSAAELRVLRWESLTDDTPEELTSDLRDLVLGGEGESIVVAFVPTSTATADIPRPPSEPALARALGLDDTGATSTTAVDTTALTTPSTVATPPSTAGG